MNKPIKTAICSFGMSGQIFHGPTLKVSEKFNVVQVLERTKDLSKDVFPKADIVRSYEKILENSEIELVIVNTPDEFHYKMVQQALDAGKNVVVEKPVTQKSGEVEELIKLAKQKGLIHFFVRSEKFLYISHFLLLCFRSAIELALNEVSNCFSFS